MNSETWKYLVLLCPRCGSVRYARSEQKTARCFKCGYQIPIDLSKIKILFTTDKRREALKAVKKYKMKLAEGSTDN